MFFSNYCKIFKNTCFEKHLQTTFSVLLMIKLVISIGHLFLIKNMMCDGFYYGLQIWSEYILYWLLVETIPTCFYCAARDTRFEEPFCLFHQKFLMLSQDVKNVLTKQFLKMQKRLFTNFLHKQ